MHFKRFLGYHIKVEIFQVRQSHDRTACFMSETLASKELLYWHIEMVRIKVRILRRM